jgi:hypothetical protein
MTFAHTTFDQRYICPERKYIYRERIYIERKREREKRDEGKRERERERENRRERERERWLEGKNSVFFAYRDVTEITSRLRQRDFGDFPTTDVLYRDVLRITSRQVKKAQNPALTQCLSALPDAVRPDESNAPN